jgi:hypothetical protein
MKNTVRNIAAGTFLTLALLVGFEKAKGTELRASGLDITETSLQLENWMTDENYWNAKTALNAGFILETEKETALELESWMTGENMWNLNMAFVIEAESTLELETWMTSKETWNVQEKATEGSLTLENWMTDNKIWQ